MKKRSSVGAGVATAICLAIGFASFSGNLAHTHAQSSIQSAVQQGAAMPTHATGTFEVKLTLQPLDATADAKAPDKAPDKSNDKAEPLPFARMSIDKQFHGGLEASAKGQMLTAGPDANGSAAYVAIERITGTLNGRTGSFILQHSGTLTRGAPQQSVTIVPDSGTGQLVGIAGKMTGTIDAGKHSYDLEYTLPAAP